MNKSVGLLAVFAFSFALHAFGEEAVENVFSSEDTRPLNDPAGWSLGSVPSPEDGAVISGEKTVAVLSSAICGFASYALIDGATLIVNPDCTIPNLTLGAGTRLVIDKAPIVQTYPGHIPGPGNKVLVGWMRPECSISEIRDIAGHISGTTWNKSLQGTPYGYVTNIVLKSDSLLECQFQNYNLTVDQDYTKGVIVEFTKDSSGNIYANVAKEGARYYKGNLIGSDLWGGTKGNIALAPNQNGYGVQNISFALGLSGSRKTVSIDSLTVAGGEVDVAEGYILDLSDTHLSMMANLVKTGDGVIAFGDVLPSSLKIAKGVLCLLHGVEYDMSLINLGEGVEVKVVVDGEICEAHPVEMVNGKTKYLLSYAYAGDGKWNELSNWEGGVLPGATDTVYVVGSGSVLAIDDVDAVMPKEIVVMDGATLKIGAPVNLPQIKLIGTGSLVVATDMEWDPSRHSFVAVGEKVPSVTICSGAKLSVPGDTKFKNVNMTVKGAIEASSAGAIYFGYAKSGEVSRFGLLADGASFKMADGVENGKGGYYFASPEQGGRVKVAGVIRIKDSNFNLAEKMGAVKKYQGFCFGKNNPVDEPLLVDITGTVIDCTADSYIGGSAVVSFGDGGVMRNPINNAQSGRASHIYVVDKARLVFGEGSQFLYPISGNWTGSGINFSPDDDEYPALELKNGGAFASYVTKGNGKARVDFKSAFFEVICGTWYGHDRLSHVFCHFKAAHVNKGDTLTIRRAKYDIGSNQSDDGFIVTDIVAPIKGDGDVVVTNATKKSFSLIVQRGDNENKGKISVHGENCQLWFADGANWKGTVVANGKIGISAIHYKDENAGIEGETPHVADGKVNTDGTIPYPFVPVTVAFAKLDLQADFPVKVWKDDDGNITGNDTLNVGEYINNGGRLVPTLAGEGEFVLGDKIVVGEIGDSSPLPRVAKGWTASRKTIDGKGMLMLSKGVGFLMIVR